MSDSGGRGEKRLPSAAEAYGVVALMVAILAVGSAVLELEVKVLLCFCAALNALLAWRCGYSWTDLISFFAQKVADLSGTLVIILTIGMVVAAWMASGTAPALVAWLSMLIDPQHILMFSFILTAIMSVLIGSSFATMGTLGIVMFSTAIAQGIPAGMAAASVICGANVGQFVSPLADVTSYISGLNGISLYDHIKQLAIPTAISCVVSVAVFYLMGRGYAAGEESLIAVRILEERIAETFVLNPAVIIPLVLALGLCFAKLNPAIVLFISSITAVIVAVAVQGQSATECLMSLWYGFDSSIMLPGIDIAPEYAAFLNRGGAGSMGDSILFIIVAMLAMSSLELAGVFKTIQQTAFRQVSSIQALAGVTAAFAGLFTIATGDSYTTSAVLASSLRDLYVDAGYHPRKIAALGTAWCFTVEQILPWSFIAVYSASVYGVQVADFVPGCVFYYALAAATLIMTLLGVDNKRLGDAHEGKQPANLADGME